jgi:hypothetical protein
LLPRLGSAALTVDGIVHQAGASGALVLDDCKAPCLTGHHVGMNADKWTVGGDAEQPLAIVAGALPTTIKISVL